MAWTNHFQPTTRVSRILSSPANDNAPSRFHRSGQQNVNSHPLQQIFGNAAMLMQKVIYNGF
jgi:hypothetical protein